MGNTHENSEITKEFTEDNQKIAASNARVLHLIHLANLTLEQADIAHVFYKGPIQQMILYGDFFAKPSVDADILVAHADFTRAREALTAAGFFMPAECTRLWWRMFLGEQHMFHPESGRHSLDLHHRLQQPGSPPPRHTERFLLNPRHVKLGSRGIPTPGLANIALISAMNMVKAICNREPGGSYAMDLLTVLRRMTPEQRTQAETEARLQGIERTVAFASRVSALVFGVEDLLSSRPLPLPIDESALERLLLCPAQASHEVPRRRTILRYLCDHVIPDFPVEAARWVLSEGARAAVWLR